MSEGSFHLLEIILLQKFNKISAYFKSFQYQQKIILFQLIYKKHSS